MRVGSGTLLGRYVQRPSDSLRRLLDYSKWLADGETVTAIAVTVTPATDTLFAVGTFVIGPDGQKVAYYASGGEDGEEYFADFKVTTTVRDSWTHTVRFAVREPTKYDGS